MERSFRSALCNCSLKSWSHVHCQCQNCNGRAVHRKTQLNHLRLEFDIHQIFHGTSSTNERIPEEESPQPHNSQTVDNPIVLNPNDQELSQAEDDDQSITPINDVETLSCQDVEQVNQDEPAERDQITNVIIHAIFQSLDCLDKMNGSLNNFEDLLSLAKDMYCKGAQLDPFDEDIMNEWPKNWTDAKRLLVNLGYTDAKEYFICLNNNHPCHWDILERKDEQCRHCGNVPTIPYYYLGLETKIKLWVSSKSMCHKMTAHWREKEHWLGRDQGWHIKKELWDGDRFAEISWFFNNEAWWCLPVRCRKQECRNIISGEIVDSLPEMPNGMKEVTCDECHHSFTIYADYCNGDPRNIALIGHWDGFQPFGSSIRSSGAIEVCIATMSKIDRANAEEVYTVGFIPSYLLPDKRPNSLDPFLEPLVTDLERGFIEGFTVFYKGNLPLFPPAEITVRVLLLLWTGDHLAQCEVCKSKGAGGKKACRRCKLVGQYMAAQKHYYYPGFRKNYRFPIEERKIVEEIPILEEIGQEERVTVAESKSRESGFLGVSLLHRLSKLYKFDILKDLVFDVMHLVPLNLVKRRLEHFITNSLVNTDELQANLKLIPWTKEYRGSRFPRDISGIGHWKAEEFQKFGYPASEYVLEDLNPDDKEVWASLPRIVEFIFNSGINGWTRDMVCNFTRLCWRYCILVEECYGITECLITLHCLTHVPEDIMRFSTPDNYWCFQYERAVGRYVKQTSNKKGIEKTFARKESQREFIKTWSHAHKHDIFESKQSGKYYQEKMAATSLQAAKDFVQMYESQGNQALQRHIQVLIGKGEIHIITREEKIKITDCLANMTDVNDFDIFMTESYRSVYVPLQGVTGEGILYRPGETIIAQHNNSEVVMKILHFYLVHVQGQYIPVIIGDSYEVKKDEGNNDLRHPFSDTPIVQPFAPNVCFHLRNLRRKIMLYPLQDDQFAVIDPSRTHIPLPHVLVPVFPQIGDMVLVRGDGQDLWRAEIRTTDHNLKVASGYFFVKHGLWNQNSLWVRESQRRAMDRIMYQSIIDIVDGQWHGAAWKDKD